MKKRLLSLLVLAIALTVTPAAMADHCEGCRPLTQTCGPRLNFGWEICYWDVEGCHLELPCGDHTPSFTGALASEFTVASVERLDEPATAQTTETLVASAAAATPAPALR